MGFTPQEVEAMSLWQFQAASVGWAEANGAKADGGLTQDEFERAAAALDAAPDVTT